MVTWPLFGTLQGLYLPNASSQTLQTSKRHTFRVSITTFVWEKTVFCRLCAGQSRGTLKREKCCFFLSGSPRYKIPEFFNDSTRPHLLFDSLPPKSRQSVVSIWDLRCITNKFTIITKKHSRSDLAWSRPRADRGLSWPTSVLRIAIGVCKVLSRSVEIWQCEGQKPVLE